MATPIQVLCVFLATILLVANAEPIEVGHTYHFTLTADSQKYFEIVVPTDIKSQSMHVQAATIAYNPYQMPSVDITNSTYTRACYGADVYFQGICLLEPQILKAGGSKWIITVNCSEDCDIQFKVYFSAASIIKLGSSYIYSALEQISETVKLLLEIPSGVEFSQIGIEANIEKFYNATESLRLYANVGDSSVAFPSETLTQFTGISLFSLGQGIFLSQKDATSGQTIAIIVQIPPTMKIEVKSYVILKNLATSMELDASYRGFCVKDAPKVYVLDLTKKSSILQDSTILVNVKIYSGNPQIHVSFSDDFSGLLPSYSSIGNLHYMITESLRKQYKFTGIVYMRLTTELPTDYQISNTLQSDGYSILEEGEPEFFELQVGESREYYYPVMAKIEERTVFDKMYAGSFVVKIKIYNGAAALALTRCQDYQTRYNASACHISSCGQLSNGRNKIDVTTTMQGASLHYYSFSYDFRNCTRKYSNGFTSSYMCAFQFISCNTASRQTDYSISIMKRSYASHLKEGSPVQDAVAKNQYVYYSFSQQNLTDLEKISFYLTTLEGKVLLIASTSEPYPLINDQTLQAQSAATTVTRGGIITFSPYELKNNYFVGVYGVESASYTLVTLLQRRSTKSAFEEAVRMELSEGATQDFILGGATARVDFEVSVDMRHKYSVEVTQLKGEVRLQVQDSQHINLECDPTESTRTTCSFQPTSTGKHIIKVSKLSILTDSHFIVAFGQKYHCTAYILGSPLLVEITPAKSSCSKYLLNKVTEVEISISLSTLQILDANLLIQYCINGKNCRPFKNQQAILTEQELLANCDVKSSNQYQFSKACQILVLSSTTHHDAQFYLVAEESYYPKALFDGLTRKVTVSHTLIEKAVYFYYKIIDKYSDLKIFVDFISPNGMTLLAHFAEMDVKVEDFYLGFHTQSPRVYRSYISKQGLTMMKINSSDIQLNCMNCFLTVSVFPESDDNDTVFEMEMTQSESILKAGVVKSNIISRYQIYTYSLKVTQTSILAIRESGKGSLREKDCFTAHIYQSGEVERKSEIKDGLFSFLNENMFTQFDVVLQGNRQGCNVQISLKPLKGSLTEIKQNDVHSVDISTNTTSYFLYAHNSLQSFKIVEYLSSGKSNMYAIAFDRQTAYADSHTDLSTFTFHSTNDMFMISNTSWEFCSNCHYLIAIHASTNLQCQISIILAGNPIPLRASGNIEALIDQSKIDHYILHSSGLNITVKSLYGEALVAVRAPNGELSHYTTRESSLTIVIPTTTPSYLFAVESALMRYDVSVTAKIETRYYIKVERSEEARRVFEGIPSAMKLPAKISKTIEFINLVEQKDGIISVLVQLIHCRNPLNTYTSDCSKMNLNVNSESSGKNNRDLLISQTRVENSINYQFKQQKAAYYLHLSSETEVDLTILFISANFTHLAASNALLMDREATFQLYTPSRPVFIQIQNCIGQITIQASSKYQDIQNTMNSSSSGILLEQTNYGNHYFITLENQVGEYFVKVVNRRGVAPLLYTITYDFYEANQQPFFKMVKLPRPQIQYNFGKNEFQFKIASILLKKGVENKFIRVIYTIFVAKGKEEIDKYSKCSKGTVFNLKQEIKAYANEQIAFSMEHSAINKAIDSQEIFYVGARAEVHFTGQNKESTVELLYEVLQIANQKMQISRHDESTNYWGNGLLIVGVGIFWTIAIIYSVKRCLRNRLTFGQLTEEGAPDPVELKSSSQTKRANQGPGTNTRLAGDIK